MRTRDEIESDRDTDFDSFENFLQLNADANNRLGEVVFIIAKIIVKQQKRKLLPEQPNFWLKEGF